MFVAQTGKKLHHLETLRFRNLDHTQPGDKQL